MPSSRAASRVMGPGLFLKDTLAMDCAGWWEWRQGRQRSGRGKAGKHGRAGQ